MKFWQIANGDIAVRKDKYFRCYHVKDTNFESVLNSIEKRKYKILCINDTANTTDFENKKEKVKEVFSSILPEKSSFEKNDLKEK